MYGFEDFWLLAMELLACSLGLSVDGVTQLSNSKILRYDNALKRYFIPKVSPTVLDFAKLFVYMYLN
jgi:hypothetical protein